MTGWRSRPAESAERLRQILQQTKVIAVVGASTDPWRPSFGIFGYLKRAGYQVVPVNPNEVGRNLQGEQFVASLRDIDQRVDLVNVFRRSDALPELVEEALSIRAPVLWTQLGVCHEEACARAEAAGMNVVMNRCISVEHARLGR